MILAGGGLLWRYREPMPKRATDKARKKDDPNRLQRVEGGRYRSADDRFAVRQSGVGWLLVDSARTDELGQPVVHGPFPTLDAVREAIPEARRQK